MMILIAILTSFLSFAQNCSELNLITQTNSPFSKMPVLDQAGSGMCYAYTAAQLANYQLIKSGHADRPMVHPAWAGILAKEKEGEYKLAGGYTNLALDQIGSIGNCDERLVHQAIQARIELLGQGVPEAKIMKFLDNYGEVLRKQGLNPNNEASRREALRQAAAKNPTCDLAHWQRLMDKPELLAQDSVTAVRTLLASSCENTPKLNLPAYQRLTRGSDDAIEARINSALENNNPLGMTFCSWAADKPQPTPPRMLNVDPNGNRLQAVTDNACGAHIALIAGRKEINGSCNYLYRNSRGTGWYRDIQHLTCLCKNKRTNEFVDNCTYRNNNSPNIIVEACWVPKATLVPNIFSLIHY